MEHDVVLARKDHFTKYLRIYGRTTPSVGDIITLPIGGQLVKARVGQSVDHHSDAVEFEEFE